MKLLPFPLDVQWLTAKVLALDFIQFVKQKKLDRQIQKIHIHTHKTHNHIRSPRGARTP